MDAHVVLELREDAPHGLSDMVWGHFHLSGFRVYQDLDGLCFWDFQIVRAMNLAQVWVETFP